jgi:hypothetical protein
MSEAVTEAPGGAELKRLCREALGAVDRALHAPPNELKEPADEAERAAVRVRDTLIELLRAGPPADRARRWRGALERANVAVSLLAGLEYPAAGAQQQPLKDARRVLQGLARRNLS